MAWQAWCARGAAPPSKRWDLRLRKRSLRPPGDELAGGIPVFSEVPWPAPFSGGKTNSNTGGRCGWPAGGLGREKRMAVTCAGIVCLRAPPGPRDLAMNGPLPTALAQATGRA